MNLKLSEKVVKIQERLTKLKEFAAKHTDARGNIAWPNGPKYPTYDDYLIFSDACDKFIEATKFVEEQK